MARRVASLSFVKVMSQRTSCRSAVRPVAETVFSSPARYQASSSLPSLSSHIARLRGAVAGLESLQPLHAARSQSLLVSRLSFGSCDSASWLQDLYGSKKR